MTNKTLARSQIKLQLVSNFPFIFARRTEPKFFWTQDAFQLNTFNKRVFQLWITPDYKSLKYNKVLIGEIFIQFFAFQSEILEIKKAQNLIDSGLSNIKIALSKLKSHQNSAAQHSPLRGKPQISFFTADAGLKIQ
jgi:hypothetical protein